MAADRGAFVDQSQSRNIHMSDPTYAKVSNLHFYAWTKGLKTGMYYLRTRAAAEAIKFTVDQRALMKKNNIKRGRARKPCDDIEKGLVALNVGMDREETCPMCSG